MKYLLRCLSCGWEKEEVAKFMLIDNCPVCEAKLITVVNTEANTEEDERIAEEIEKIRAEEIEEIGNNNLDLLENIQNMKKKFDEKDLEIIKYQIKTYGKKKCWRVIENIKDPYRRIEERQLFFKALEELKKEETK